MKTGKVCLFFSALVLLAACGGNTISRLPQNEILGEVPSIVYQKEQQDSIRQAKGHAKAGKAGNEEQLTKLASQYAEEAEKAQKAYAEALEKEGEKLKGRDVPFTIAESSGYEITSLKIKGASEEGEVSVGYTVKLTDVSKIHFFRSMIGLGEGKINLPVRFVDKEGNVLGKDLFHLFLSDPKLKKASDLTNGMEVSFYNHIPVADDARGYSGFARIEFLPTK